MTVLNHTPISVKDGVKWMEESNEDNALPRIRDGYIPIKHIHTNLEVFQSRMTDNFNDREYQSELHIKELKDRLKLTDLDSIDIYDVGGKYYVINGYHRLEAYVQAGKSQIPVKVFKGSPFDAMFFGIEDNMKFKLKLSKDEKSNLAWRFIAEDSYILSKKDTAIRFGISVSLVSKMRAEAKRYIDGDSDIVTPLEWWKVTQKQGDSDNINEGEILAKKLLPLLKGNRPNVVAKAMSMLGDKFYPILHEMNTVKPYYPKIEDDTLVRKPSEFYFLNTILNNMSKMKDKVTRDIEEREARIEREYRLKTRNYQNIYRRETPIEEDFT
jgi:hypothetical protein